MSDRQDWDTEISSLLKNIYRCADKSSWYDAVAVAYDRTRPRYPAKLLARMQELAQLTPGKSVLEIGSGPGIATVELAKLGANILGLEPSLSASTLARINCAAYPNVEVLNTTFESWELVEHQFEAIVAATSFHWVSPEVRNVKTAAALKDNGLLVLLWNTPPQPDYEVFQKLLPVYQTQAPELAKYQEHQSHQQNLVKIADEAIDSGYFRDLTSEELISKVTYTVDDYLTLLSTLSPYIRLESSQRNTLFTELKQVLENNYGTSIELTYLSLLQTVRKN